MTRETLDTFLLPRYMTKKLVFKLPSGKTVPIRKALLSASLIKKAVRKRVSLRKLSGQVKAIKRNALGSVQYSRQKLVYRNAWTPPGGGANQVPSRPTNLRPIVFLHQAISAGAQVHSCQYSPGIAPAFSTLTPAVVGTWTQQAFPITTSIANGGYGCDPAVNNRNDQLQYLEQAEGVQNKYTHISTEYAFSVKALQARGYVDVFMLHPKRTWVRSTAKDVSMPSGLAGMTNLSLGTAYSNQYSMNGMYYTKKHLKRHYFNTIDPQNPLYPNERFLQTNPDYNFNLKITNDKTRSTIKATELFQGGILDYTDIPILKQDWIMVSTTLENADVTALNYVDVQIIRSCKWRDLLGASA